MNALGRCFQKLLKTDTWQRPKNIWVLLIVAILVPILVGLAISFGNYLVEAHFRSMTISVEYHPVAVLKGEDLDNYAQTNEFAIFKRNLDDDVLDNYFVVPFILRNSTRNPVEKASFKIDMGCHIERPSFAEDYLGGVDELPLRFWLGGLFIWFVRDCANNCTSS